MGFRIKTFALVLLASFTFSSTFTASAEKPVPVTDTLMLYSEDAVPMGPVSWDQVKSDSVPDVISPNDYGLFKVILNDGSEGWLDSSQFDMGVTGTPCDKVDIQSAGIATADSTTAGGMGAGGDC